MSVFSLRVWGCRGSLPTPGPRTQRYGGNTSCVELRRADSVFILDSGTGIRELGDALSKELQGRPLTADVFITHTHWDHIHGFPFFVPAYVPGNRLRIHGANVMGRGFETIFRGLMDPGYFPVDIASMASKIEFKELKGEPFESGGTAVRTIFTNHPGMDLAYRFEAQGKSVVYLTDHEPYQAMNGPTEYSLKQDLLIQEFCCGADLLVCDAQYTDQEYEAKRTWGHSRWTDAVRLALAAQAKRLWLYHHDPSHGDDFLDAIAHDAQALAHESGRTLECAVAREGLSIEI